jgi:hypothetical protein
VSTTTLTLYENLALLIGGPQPDAANHPDWWAGAGGVAGVVGCFSVPPSMIQNPVTKANITGVFGIIRRSPFTARRGGVEVRHEMLRLRLLIQATGGVPSAEAIILPYADIIPDTLRGSMMLDPAGAVTLDRPVLEAFVTGGTPIDLLQIAGERFIGWDFTVNVDRSAIRTMTR